MARNRRPTGPHIIWRRRAAGPARAYGDFRGVGGGREPLTRPGERVATTDPVVAQEAFARRLRELSDRGGRSEPGRRITLEAAVAGFLEHRRRQGRVTGTWLDATAGMLGRAVQHFGPTRRLRTIDADAIVDWLHALQHQPTERGGTYAAESCRKHLSALSALFKRGMRAGWVANNPVTLLEPAERPAVPPSRTAWLEVPEAARLLEAARTYPLLAGEPEMRLAYPLLATFLLTGGRADEVLGLDVADVLFDRSRVAFRPNAWRRGKQGKTAGAERLVPLFPQLEAILHRWLQGDHLDLRLRFDTTLLFPSPYTGGRITDIRGVVDRVARRAGLREGIYRSRAFRITYATARLMTLDHGRPIAPKVVATELGHSSEEMVRRIYGRLGDFRHRSDVVEYLIAENGVGPLAGDDIPVHRGGTTTLPLKDPA